MKKKRHNNPLVMVKRSSAGLGLFAAKPIKKGDFIIEYTGEVLTKAEADERGGKYLFETSARRFIDGSGRENTARYINHACKPNCEIDIVRGKILVSALKNIKEGEELNYDYGEEYFDAYIKPHGCRCDPCKKKKKK